MPTRPEWYRRRGPDGPSSLQPVLDRSSSLVNKQSAIKPCSRRDRGAAVPVLVGAIAARKKIGMHPALTLALGCGPPLGMAIAVPRGRKRYAAVAAAYMHLFKLAGSCPTTTRRSCESDSGSTSRSASTPSSASVFRRGCACSARCAGPAR